MTPLSLFLLFHRTHRFRELIFILRTGRKLSESSVGKKGRIPARDKRTFYSLEKKGIEEKGINMPPSRLTHADVVGSGCYPGGKRRESRSSYLYHDAAKGGWEEIDGDLPSNSLRAKVDVSRNNLSSLHALAGLKSLTHLNASKNKLTSALSFKTIRCAVPEEGQDIVETAQGDGEMRIGSVLRHANVSHNRIRVIGDISWHRRLISLDLSHNKIKKIRGIQALPVLRSLDLSSNKISTLRGLPALLERLSIDNNCIRSLDHASSLQHLRYISAKGNCINTVEGLKGSRVLADLLLDGNIITLPEDARHISALPLQRVSFAANPMCSVDLYRYRVVQYLQSLQELDGQTVTSEFKVKARNVHGADSENRHITFYEQYDASEPFVVHLHPFSPPDAGRKLRRERHARR